MTSNSIESSGKEFPVKSTHVAYGCKLTSMIDYNYLLLVMLLDGSKRRSHTLPSGDVIEYGTVGARGLGIARGTPKCNGAMKNCIIIDYAIRVNGGDEVGVSAKVFKSYLHFCNNVDMDSSGVLADDLIRLIRETQEVIECHPSLADRLKTISTTPGDYLNPEDVHSLEDRARSARLCIPDLSRMDIQPTMSNHIVNLGSYIHSVKLCKIIQQHKCRTRQWTVTFDNSLLMVIRILVPYLSSTDDEGYRFTIHPTGNMSYSCNDMDDEAQSVRREVLALLRESMPLVSIDPPSRRSTPRKK